ncbi:MAG TPA: insulinase family protein, partial [Gemmatimonadaceae bacterium]|nr:insulinase family protein [Gemmatimonadaceae bacterium]
MRCRWIKHASAFALLLVMPSLLEAQRAELEHHIRRSTLANGLEIIVVENHGVPLVTIEADVKNGSFTQGPEYEGLSHLYEHMFFKANAAYPNPDDFVARASELGAQFNGTTSEERVNYYLTVPADSIQGGMNFLGAALMTPLFRKDELEREREVVIGEYDRNESSPFFQFNTSMSKALWTTA